MTETVYSELELGNPLKLCNMMLSDDVINSPIVSKGAMNSFKEMFPLARMFPVVVMHSDFHDLLKTL